MQDEPATPAPDMVEAVDRLLAADILDEVSNLLNHNGIGQVADLIRDGEYDEHDCVTIAVRHRIAALTACRAQVEPDESVLEMVNQLRQLARKQEGVGMSFSDPSPSSGGMASINLYGDRAKAAIWLFKNADRIADAITRNEHRSADMNNTNPANTVEANEPICGWCNETVKVCNAKHARDENVYGELCTPDADNG